MKPDKPEVRSTRREVTDLFYSTLNNPRDRNTATYSFEMLDYLSFGQKLSFLAQECFIVALTFDLYDVPLMLISHEKIRRSFVTFP